jgi:hypothetical protein
MSWPFRKREARLRGWAIVVALITLPSVGVSDENSEANRVFVKAVTLIEEAKGRDISTRAKLYAEAKDFLLDIIKNYTGSNVAVKLISSENIGNFSYIDFLSEEKLISKCINLINIECINTIIYYTSNIFNDLQTLDYQSFYRARALYDIGSAQLSIGRTLEAEYTFVAAKRSLREAQRDIQEASRRAEGLVEETDLGFSAGTSNFRRNLEIILGTAREHVSTLLKIAEAQAKIGYLTDAAKETITEARQTADGITPFYHKALAFSEIAGAEARSGFGENSIQTFAKARSIAEQADRFYTNNQVQAISAIATDQAKVGFSNDATETFAEARRIADSITELHSKAWALAEIAIAQREAGFIEDATTTLAAAVDVAKASDSSTQGLGRPGLPSLAVAQAKIGFVDDAVATFEQIRPAFYAVEALREIAVAQARVGLRDDALATVNTISALLFQHPHLQAIERIEREQALTSIAATQAEAGYLTDALVTAAQISWPGYKTEALRTIALAQSPSGKFMF